MIYFVVHSESIFSWIVFIVYLHYLLSLPFSRYLSCFKVMIVKLVWMVFHAQDHLNHIFMFYVHVFINIYVFMCRYSSAAADAFEGGLVIGCWGSRKCGVQTSTGTSREPGET